MKNILLLSKLIDSIFYHLSMGKYLAYTCNIITYLITNRYLFNTILIEQSRYYEYYENHVYIYIS